MKHWILMVVLLLSALAVGAAILMVGHRRTIRLPSGISIINAADPEELSRFADNVFVGRVVSREGTINWRRKRPRTRFTVAVERNIKGEFVLNNPISVEQEGGFSLPYLVVVLIDRDVILVRDQRYLFATKFDAKRQVHRIVPYYGNMPINTDTTRKS